MKKLVFPLIFLVLGYLIFYFIFEKRGPLHVSKYSKGETKSINDLKKRPSETNLDEEDIDGPTTEFEPLREKPSEPSVAPPVDRRYIGQDFKPVEAPPSGIVFENSVNPNWENLLIREFFDGDKPDGNIEIKKLDSFVYLKGNSGLYVEKVSVNVTAPKEMAGTFYAYVNSGTGEILHAWEGEEEGPPDEVAQIPEDSSPSEVENTALDIPESTIEEGIEFTEEETGSAQVDDTFYPDYN